MILQKQFKRIRNPSISGTGCYYTNGAKEPNLGWEIWVNTK